MSDQDQTKPDPPPFDFSKFSEDTLFYERRESIDRRILRPSKPAPAPSETARAPIERRAKKERRRRIDPTTFEKQYTDDELEFMNAMQEFKSRTGRPFPTHGEVLKVAFGLGYRKTFDEVTDDDLEDDPSDSVAALPSR